MDPVIEAVLDANQAFYDAHEARDLEAMRAVWEHSDRVVCVHPGWPILRTWPARRGFVAAHPRRARDATSSSSPIDAVAIDGDTAWVTLDENLVDAGGTGTVAATNLYVRRDGRGCSSRTTARRSSRPNRTTASVSAGSIRDAECDIHRDPVRERRRRRPIEAQQGGNVEGRVTKEVDGPLTVERASVVEHDVAHGTHQYFLHLGGRRLARGTQLSQQEHLVGCILQDRRQIDRRRDAVDAMLGGVVEQPIEHRIDHFLTRAPRGNERQPAQR